MFIRLETSSAVPIYRQIIDQVKYQIACGALRPGRRMPSIRDLARQLPANQNTVLKAYDLLSREGVLTRRQGDGTFVADAPSALKKSQRRKQVAAILAQAAAQAVHFQVTPDDLHEMLDQQIDVLVQTGDSHG